MAAASRQTADPARRAELLAELVGKKEDPAPDGDENEEGEKSDA